MGSGKKYRGREASPALKEWAANGAWLAAWGAIFTLCVGVFGETVALFAVLATVIATGAVWYATGRRDEKQGRA